MTDDLVKVRDALLSLNPWDDPTRYPQLALDALQRIEEQLEAAVPQWLYDSKVDELRSVEEQLEAANRVVEAARLLTRRDTFDMRIVKVREDNLMDALREYDAASSPASSPQKSYRLAERSNVVARYFLS